MNSCVPPHEAKYLFPLRPRMLELGNKKNENGVYKQYFESLGIDHVSIDWNGEDGALKLDLTQPITLPPFDIITNFGTTEHVHDQQAVWQNIHHLLNVGGVLVSTTPILGQWWWHGEYYPQPEFFEQFEGYRIERMGIEKKYPQQMLCVRLLKYEHRELTFPLEYIDKNVRRRRSAGPKIS